MDDRFGCRVRKQINDSRPTTYNRVLSYQVTNDEEDSRDASSLVVVGAKHVLI